MLRKHVGESNTYMQNRNFVVFRASGSFDFLLNSVADPDTPLAAILEQHLELWEG